MPSNPKRPGASASQSFKAIEIRAALQLLETLRAGGDVTRILQHEGVVGLEAKLRAMERSLERQMAFRVIEGGRR